MIKGYLPLRVVLPSRGDTFLFVKQHHASSSSSKNDESSVDHSLFICNVPFVPNVRTQVFLTALFQKFGTVEKVIVVRNPRKNPSTKFSDEDGVNNSAAVQRWKEISARSLFPEYDANDEGKFAHVHFASSSEMRSALRTMQKTLKGVEITSLELQQMQSKQDLQMDNDDDIQSDTSGDGLEKSDKKTNESRLLRLVERYRATIIPRDELLNYCNAVMESFESAEEKARMNNKSLSEPDEDGFVTVTSNVPSKLVGSKRELEVDGGMLTGSNVDEGRRSGRNKKLRTRKKASGASELTDFYRFQRRETRQKGLHDLRKRFEGDLIAVQKVKEQKMYRPFQE